MQDSTSMSGTTSRPTFSLSTQGRGDLFSQDKVFPFMLEEVCEKAKELEACGKQHNTVLNSKKFRLRSLSNTEPEDYKVKIYRKGIFLDNLTQVVEDLVDNSLENDHKFTINCYNEFASLFETRCNESKQDIQQKTELMKEQKCETARLIAQGNIFANLVEEENEDLRNQELRQADLQFEEAKADLVKVLNVAYPDEEERSQFLLVMAKLVEAHINNLDSVEDQYVEVPPASLLNPGLRCLMSGFVVVEHPHDPRKLRLSVDE